MSWRLPFTSLDAVTATGPGVQQSADNPYTGGTLLIAWTGSPTALRFQVEGSLDGVNWMPVFDFDAGAYGWLGGGAPSPQYRSWSSSPVVYIRANLVTLSGGSSPTVTITLLGQTAG